jgi:hypothetical protein
MMGRSATIRYCKNLDDCGKRDVVSEIYTLYNACLNFEKRSLNVLNFDDFNTDR